jgi:hypothetical protein
MAEACGTGFSLNGARVGCTRSPHPADEPHRHVDAGTDVEWSQWDSGCAIPGLAIWSIHGMAGCDDYPKVPLTLPA